MSDIQFFRYPVFQVFSFPPRLDAVKFWHRRGHVHDAVAIPSVITKCTALLPTVARSRAFPAPAFGCPRAATPSPTRRPRCQFSTISVNTKTQPVELIRKHKYKCAN
jgi:hypothetical protein